MYVCLDYKGVEKCIKYVVPGPSMYTCVFSILLLCTLDIWYIHTYVNVCMCVLLRMTRVNVWYRFSQQETGNDSSRGQSVMADTRHTHTHIRLQRYTHTYRYIYTYILIQICLYAGIHIRLYTQTLNYTYTHTELQIYQYIEIHI